MVIVAVAIYRNHIFDYAVILQSLFYYIFEKLVQFYDKPKVVKVAMHSSQKETPKNTGSKYIFLLLEEISNNTNGNY